MPQRELETWIESAEAPARLVTFLAVFAVMAAWEVVAARRELSAAKGRRWLANLGLVAVDAVAVRLLFPAAAVGAALGARELGLGLFNNVSVPYWLAVVATVVALDFAIYLQHVMFHAIPALWRLHRVHHADVDIDVTTGIRFHPLEVIVSMLIKFAAIALLGPPLLGVALFEVVLSALAMFNHANARIPLAVDRVLRLFIVTPDMHRVHHSIDRAEHSTNFGFNLSLWDRLLGTYVAQPAAGHERMTIGLPEFRDPAWISLPRLLQMPFGARDGRGARRTTPRDD
jgi:sterol desaturase/sphingolipid hydroxylase (fatty acid hydroxylase superfamily)